MGTFAYANEASEILLENNDLIELKLESNENLNIIKPNILYQSYNILFQQCKVRITGTVGGKPVDVTVEFTADDCLEGTVKVLKRVLKDVLD